MKRNQNGLWEEGEGLVKILNRTSRVLWNSQVFTFRYDILCFFSTECVISLKGIRNLRTGSSLAWLKYLKLHKECRRKNTLRVYVTITIITIAPLLLKLHLFRHVVGDQFRSQNGNLFTSRLPEHFESKLTLKGKIQVSIAHWVDGISYSQSQPKCNQWKCNDSRLPFKLKWFLPKGSLFLAFRFERMRILR